MEPLAVLLQGAAIVIAAQAAAPIEVETNADTGGAGSDEDAGRCDDTDDARRKGCRRDPNTVEGLTIEGQKRGKTEGPIEPEVVLDEVKINAYGARNFSELMAALAPMLQGNRGRGDEPPLTLLNGQRTGGPQETRSLPLGAIQKIEIFPEEKALAYGYRADQKVMNVVLKKNFRAVTVQGEAKRATDGGRASTDQQVTLFKSDEKMRATLDMRYQRGSPIYEQERDIVRAANGAPYDLTGNITGSPIGVEIDPALSALAGSPVTTAIVPTSAADGAPGLAAFTPGAGRVASDDLTTSRTLVPRTEAFSLDAVYNRNLGYVTTTISGGFDRSNRVSFQGLPAVSVALPAGSPFSPFGRDVILHRAFDARDALRQKSDTDKVEAGLTMLGMAKGWRWTFTGAFDRTETTTRTGRGLDFTAYRAAVAAGDPTVNPFGPVSGALLPYAPRDTGDSVTTNAKAELVATGSLFEVPAGWLRATLKTGIDTRGLDSVSVRSGVRTERDLNRQRETVSASLDLPISRREGALSFLGDVSINGNALYEAFSDIGGLVTLGGGVTWSPVKGLRLTANYSTEEGEQPLQLLNGPILQTYNVSMYDFATGQTAIVTRIDGGNPNLKTDDRQVLKLGFTYKPFEKRELSFNANYTASRIDDLVANLPSISPELEAAFPERFIRDATGRLTAVDVRAVNFAHADREEIVWGLNYAFKWNQPPMPAPGRPVTPPKPGTAAGPGPGNLSIGLTHRWRLRDEVVIRRGMAPLNLLDGASLGRVGGTPRHEVTLQGNIYQNGLGAFGYATWRSATRVDGGVSGDDLRFSAVPVVNLQGYVFFGGRPAWVKARPWLSGTWLTLGVENVFNTKQDVRDSQGQTPLAYQKDYMDRIGRTVKLSLRKQF